MEATIIAVLVLSRGVSRYLSIISNNSKGTIKATVLVLRIVSCRVAEEITITNMRFLRTINIMAIVEDDLNLEIVAIAASKTQTITLALTINHLNTTTLIDKTVNGLSVVMIHAPQAADTITISTTIIISNTSISRIIITTIVAAAGVAVGMDLAVIVILGASHSEDVIITISSKIAIDH